MLFTSGSLNAATITWDTADSTALLGEVFSLNIVGLGFVDLVDGGGVNISFDPTVLRVVTDGVSIDSSVWDLGFPGVDPGTIDNVAGTVSGLKVNTMRTDVTGDFILATVQFEVLGTYGLSSVLSLSDEPTNPWASGGFLIDPYPTFVNGNFSAVPVPAAVWLFGSGFLALASFARRKQKI